MSKINNFTSPKSLDMRSGAHNLQLNFLPVTLSATKIDGYTLRYTDSSQLRNLQDSYRDNFFFRRAGSQIQAIPLSDNGLLPNATVGSFTTLSDWGLFERLLEQGVRELLRNKYPAANVPPFGRVLFSVHGENRNLVRDALSQNPNMLSKLGFLQIFRKYYLFASHIKEKEHGTMQFGLVIDIGTDWHINANVIELVAKGIDLAGCFLVPLERSQEEQGIGGVSIGSISKIDGTDVHLADFRDQQVVDGRRFTIEATLENVTRCANAVLGSNATTALLLLRGRVGQLTSADGQLDRIRNMGAILSHEVVHCAVGLTAQVGESPVLAGQDGSLEFKAIEPPKYVLRYARETTSRSISSAIASQGPFDQDSFKKTTPHILVLTPKRYQGRVEQFLRIWRDGGLTPPYDSGFIKQFRLRGCDFHIVDFEERQGQAAEDYHQACVRALLESREMVRRYDLAFVVTRENHKLLGTGDPYLVAKAALMNSGVPVQALKLETIDAPTGNQRFVLNNLALACYAKLGGTPWVLASPKGQGISHELVIGLGSTNLSRGRFQKKDRFVGITTLFNYDGVYLVSNVSKEAAYEDYPSALQEVLLTSIQQISFQEGWQPGDRVRLIFHTYKPLKNIEIEAAKRLVNQSLPDYIVDFAFLVLGHHHDWKIYDPASPGRVDKAGKIIGEKVPERGITVLLNDQKSLLAINGPAQLKAWYQGCPSPLHLQLNAASTFTDIEYLTRQVFEFTYMSWKTYNLIPKPITIEYSEAIAHLLGRLRQIKNWNSDVLRTTQLASALWFL